MIPSPHFRFSIEKNLTKFVENFFIEGVAVRNHPRVVVMPKYAALAQTDTDRFNIGHQIPLLYLRTGVVEFDVTRWGKLDVDDNLAAAIRPAEKRSLGMPALIPASFIDVGTAADDHGYVKFKAFRIRAADGGNLFWGAIYYLNPEARLIGVSALTCAAGKDVSPYLDFQPLLLTITTCPSRDNFRFINREDPMGLLQTAQPPGSLVVEELRLAEAAS